MGNSPNAPITYASRRRLARWLVGSPLREIEQDLVLETLANTGGNRTESARLLGVSVRTLRNKINEYTALGIDIPRRARARVHIVSNDGIETAPGDSIGVAEAPIVEPELTA
jgi:regulatory Fis family protein